MMGFEAQWNGNVELSITEMELQELINIFKESMNSFNVPQKEQNEILGIIESTKGDVLAAH
jgi:truncated hemoglobin YjbI